MAATCAVVNEARTLAGFDKLEVWQQPYRDHYLIISFFGNRNNRSYSLHTNKYVIEKVGTHKKINCSGNTEF